MSSASEVITLEVTLAAGTARQAPVVAFKPREVHVYCSAAASWAVDQLGPWFPIPATTLVVIPAADCQDKLWYKSTAGGTLSLAVFGDS